jgi:subtilisin-like proprotein convertase family protein
VQEKEGEEGLGSGGLQEEEEEEMRRWTVATLTLAASTAALIAAPVAGATTYNNDTSIAINQFGPGSPYPSPITVSGTAGPITDVNVGLDGFSHAKPNDVVIALVAPGGQALMIQGCAGGTQAAFPVFLTFDDSAAAQLPSNTQLATGTFKPTSHCASANSFPAPGPGTSFGNPGPGLGGTATFASVFNGSSAIGTWNLYVVDTLGGNSGSIPGGWSLDVKPDVTPLPAATPIATPIRTPPTPVKKCKKKKPKKRAVAAACKKKKKK